MLVRQAIGDSGWREARHWGLEIGDSGRWIPGDAETRNVKQSQFARALAGREIRSLKLEIRDNFEMRMIETSGNAKQSQSARKKSAPPRHGEHRDGCKFSSNNKLDNKLCGLGVAVVKSRTGRAKRTQFVGLGIADWRLGGSGSQE